ncbi:MAG: branched-chain amino acid transaminase [Acidobacteriota bacterium]|nr:branched-chain amino acid transaminase [Acidobacteriota bacterium]
MSLQPSKYIWHHGQLVPWEQATVHVLSHSLHYGSSVFEGIRAYPTPNGTVFFRLEDHVRRLLESARIYRMQTPETAPELEDACHRVVDENQLDGAYIRPLIYHDYEALGVVPRQSSVRTTIAAFAWGAYLGEEGMEKGIDVGVSSWQRPAPNTFPTFAKAGGNYLSGILMGREAARHGYAEAIALDSNGYLSEGPGENLFVVRDGVIHTPALHHALLPGITRNTVITLARHLGYQVVEESMPREMLYVADELFFSGTAAEITPIRSIDGMQVGNGRRGSVAAALQRAFFGLFDGSTTDHWNWLEPVRSKQPLAVAVGG